MAAGILSAALQGLDTANAVQARAATLNIENKRLQMEQDKQNQELGRQKNLDALSVLNDQIETTARTAVPHLNYAKTPPVDPKTDPEGFAAWQNSDEFKDHADQATKIDQSVTDLRAKKQALQDKIIGVHTQSMRDKVDANTAAVLSGSKDIKDLSDGEMTDMFASKAKMDPSAFVADPKTGKRPIDGVNDQIHEGITTGNWEGKSGAISALVPELHLAVGHSMGGGTVTGVVPSQVHMNQDDPDHLHFTPTYQIHAEDGTLLPPVQGNPDSALPVPLQVLGKRATNLQHLGNVSAHPDLQQKINQAFQDRTTSFHKLNDDLLSAGVSPNELLPAPYNIKDVAAYSRGYVLDSANRPVLGPDGKPQFLEGGARPSTAANREDLRKQIAQEHPDWSPERVETETALSWRPEQYHGGLVTPDSQMQGSAGAGKEAKYTAGDKLSFESSLKESIARAHGADLTDMGPKDDPLNNIKDSAEQSKAREEFDAKRAKMRNDMRTGKDVTPDDYVEKPKPGTVPTHTYPNGITMEFRNGKWVRTK